MAFMIGGGARLDSEQGREFSRLQADVTARLRQHFFIDLQNGSHVFQYLILPAFDLPVAWDVFVRPRRGYEAEHVLLRTSWRVDLDREKFRTPVDRLRYPYPLVPTMEVHQLSARS